MNAAKVAAVGARRIERNLEDRRREGRYRQAAYSALCKEVTDLSRRNTFLLLDLQKANKEIDRLCHVNDMMRERIAALEDQQ